MVTALLIEDDVSALDDLATLVRAEGFEVETAQTLAEAKEILGHTVPDLILTDLVLPDGNGLELFDVLEEPGAVDVVLVTGYATIDTAVEALRKGAADYLTKPLSVSRLKAILANRMRALEMREEIGSLRRELRSLGRFGRLVGASDAMQGVYDLITRVAPTDASVLITGESGTGKELVAQTIHELSPRRRKPFVAVNCGAISATLIESELFGHTAGSFTGASKSHQGYFERANGGTIFLDEIGEMPPDLQVKLLRVLETNRFLRVGGSTEIDVELRVVSATNRAPELLVSEDRFREDLYYRLNVFPIELPPLREREGDVVLLAHAFLDELNGKSERRKSLSSVAEARLESHHWAGNVRELKNVMQRAYILADETIEPLHLPLDGAGLRAAVSDKLELPLGSSIADAERHLIYTTLAHLNGDKKRASEILGISLKTLYTRLRTYEGRAVHGSRS